MKANHSPSPGGKVVGVVGTPPKNVATPNNSSPSSGLSNHVSSLSSLSSSPTQTQNYHNALNNAKTLCKFAVSYDMICCDMEVRQSLSKECSMRPVR